MNRRERIVVLLDNFVDVESGLYDAKGTGANVHMMCAAWNKPKLGYPQLVRLLRIMSQERETLYWHLAETYIRRSERRRVHMCPRCQGVMPTWHSKNFHKHGHHNVAVVPRVIRIVDPRVQFKYVDEAISWLDEHWADPGPFIPEDLRVVAA